MRDFNNSNRIASLPKGNNHWNWSEKSSKLALHKRLHRKYGPAKVMKCINFYICGAQALDYDLTSNDGITKSYLERHIMKFKEQRALKINIAVLNDPKMDRVDDVFINFKQSMIDHKDKIQYFDPWTLRTIEKSINDLDSEMRGNACLHKNCAGCKNGTCNGVHMISYPYISCSAWC